MFGSHLSIAGTMLNALEEGLALGLDCVQVFTKNQQQWKAKPLDPGVARDWKARVHEIGWDRGGPDDRGGIVSHASYLINLASFKDDLWNSSIDLMTDEIERCEQLGIPYLVHHPGSFTGSDLASGLSRIEQAYAELFKRTRGYATVSCFECTAGAGSSIGGPLEHLAELHRRTLDRTGVPQRLGFCVDTCHLHVAGHDMSSRESATAVLERFDALCGLHHIKAMHLNDSKGALGSHLDRHEHIGEGWVGGGTSKHSGKGTFSPERLRASGFAAVVNHPALRSVPMILETPKGENAQGEAYDAVNLQRLVSILDAPPAFKERPAPRVLAGQAPKTKAKGTPKKTQGKPAKPQEKKTSKADGTKAGKTKSSKQKTNAKASKNVR